MPHLEQLVAQVWHHLRLGSVGLDERHRVAARGELDVGDDIVRELMEVVTHHLDAVPLVRVRVGVSIR